MATRLEWARDVVARGVTLFSPRTLTIGIAERVWDGDADPYVDGSGTPVRSPVIHLSTGHDLVADPDGFIELKPQEADYFAVASGRLSDFLIQGITTARQMNIPEQTAMVILAATLRGQLAALEAATPAASAIP